MMANPNLILPAGTQIVLRAAIAGRESRAGQPAGAVGVIVKAPVDQTHAYRVRFADGSEAPLRRTEFAILKQVQREGLAAWKKGTGTWQAGGREAGREAANAKTGTGTSQEGGCEAARGSSSVPVPFFDGPAAADLLDEFALLDCVIYRCIVGSRAYGLSGDESDTDRRGIYLPPAELHWSLYGVPEQLEVPRIAHPPVLPPQRGDGEDPVLPPQRGDGEDPVVPPQRGEGGRPAAALETAGGENPPPSDGGAGGGSEPLERDTYWELQKFLVLALKANPNVLECLYTPLVEYATPLAEELRAMRAAFLSKLVYQTYNGYVLSQFKKLDAARLRHGTIKWKHAMHLIRLLLAGITALREGHVPVSVEEHRERLLAIRAGTLAWDEINGWRLVLHREFDAAYAATKLPERPDYEKANGLLVKARRSMVWR